MNAPPTSLSDHRIHAVDPAAVVHGSVRYAPVKSLWFSVMAVAAVIGGAATFSWTALLVFLATTASALLLGHSLGSHRKLIHGSFECPRWLERFLVWMGVQVGLAGPLGLLRQHELRDFAQRLPECHPYLRHGAGFWRDAFWQLHCELRLERPVELRLEQRIANDPFYQWLERTWMLQQLPLAVLYYAWGGWAFVFWGICARITAGVFGHWLIGYFAHNRGPMHFHVDGAAVQGRNIRWSSLLTMGESWHNNHHAFPGSARLGIGPGEWDPGWWTLNLLQRLGLVWNVRLPEDMPERPELRALHGVPLEDSASASLPKLGWLWRQARGDGAVSLECPGIHVGADRLRTFAGVPVLPRPDACRLTARWDTGAVHGMPALWIAVARRSPRHRLLVSVLLPAAMAAEATRRFFTVPGQQLAPR